MSEGLGAAELERAYELIAEAIDRVPEGGEAAFLSRLCLALAASQRELGAVEAAIRAAEGFNQA
ncbi:MAG: hypothetical protein JSS40_10805 [Proteobacteria bacterium]|nr:hypothetical protein [Pseudomonadota bacterium]